MKKAVNTNSNRDRSSARNLLPLVALGGGLATTPAMALELGEVSVQSGLGQPLRASIAYALAPNEMLSDTCVSIGGGRSTGGLPGIGPSTVRITDNAIVITGESVIREPMLATRVTVNCRYTPNLSREYMLFVDPVAVSGTQTAAVAPAAAAVASPVVRQAADPAPRQTRRAPVETTPIAQSTRHQVKAGETLSDIVSRIENRSVSLWPAVNIVFEANPDAFIDNDPNKLKAGSWLTIPSFDGSAPVVAAAPTETEVSAPAATESAPVETTALTAPAEDDAGSVYEPPLLEEASDATAVEEPSTVDVDNPFVEPASTVLIPDTELEGPVTTSESPNVPTAIIKTGSRDESTSTFVWLIGGGLAIFGLLVLFGRRIRSRFGSAPDDAFATPRYMDDETDQVEDLADYDIEDDSPTEENLALDADLVLGTGLEEGTDMDIAQDFGIAAPTEVDIELPFEPIADIDDTDIQAPLGAKADSILDSEFLPGGEGYDVSEVVDTREMPRPGDTTAGDLQAIDLDDTMSTDSYTINQDIDFEILEQDYEDELTATQALNQEIARAAAELAEDLDGTEGDDATAEMPLASVSELDATAEMPALEDDTVETPIQKNVDDTEAVTVNMEADDETAEMAVANDDDTTEMEISGGKVDTKRK